MNKVLKVDKLRKEFGGLVAVKDVSFEVNKGEFIGLIGYRKTLGSCLTVHLCLVCIFAANLLGIPNFIPGLFRIYSSTIV